MSAEAIARRYATALADVTIASDEVDVVKQELSSWDSMMSPNPSLIEVFRNPTIPYEQKQKVLSTLISRTGVRPTTANFLKVLLHNQRLAELGAIVKRFVQILDQRAGVVSAHVTTARPIPESRRQSLRASLASMTGKDVRLSFATDESLIGGLVTRIGSTIYDGSVSNQLEAVRSKLAGDV